MAKPAALLGMLTALLSGCSSGAAGNAASASSSAEPMKNTTTPTPEPPLVHNDAPLWDVVDAVATHIPLTSDTFGQALGATMVPTYSSEWEGSGKVQLADEIQILRSELRIGDNSSAIAGFFVTGRCVTVDEVKSHYPDVRITQTPRGPKQGPPLTWSTDQSWGELNFQVNDDVTPACLISVYFVTQP
jgi:hypothetical protein